SALQVLSGEADLTVRGPRSGFDEALYARIAQMQEIAVASPIVEVDAHVEGQTDSLHVLGIDVFRAGRVQPALVGNGEPLDSLRADTVFLSAAAANWLALKPGDKLRIQIGLQAIEFRVAGLLSASAVGQRLAVMDIAAAQWRLLRPGAVTRIDLRLRPGVDANAFQARLQNELPAGVYVESPQSAVQSNLRMSRAYRVNLNVLALVALFTGGLLVLSTQALAVVRRRAELALLRVLGMTRGEIVRLLAAESMLIGGVGAGLGLLTGYALASAVAGSVGADLGAGFFAGVAPQLQLEWSAVLVYFLAGIVASLAGGILPALEAARAHPAQALKAGDEQLGYRRLQRPYRGLALAALGGLLLLLPPMGGLPIAGYVAIALLLFGTILLMPWLTAAVFSRVPLIGRPAGTLAIAHLRGTTAQAGIGLAAIVAAVSLATAMAIMVASFRDSLDQWLERMLPADLYVRTGSPSDTGFIDLNVQRAIAAVSGIQRVEWLRSQQIVLDPARPRVTLLARDLTPARAQSVLPLISNVVRPGPDDPPAVWVSEPLADLYAVRPGARLLIPLVGRAVPFTVAGIWRDYARQNGSLLIERAAYVQLTGDRLVSDAALWLSPGTTAHEVRAALLRAVANADRLELSEPGEIRRRSLTIFDRTFAVTYALEACAIIIGLFGLTSSLASQVLARRREFGMLRHIGMTRRQLATMLALEGLFSSAVGLVVGLGLGWTVSLVLIEVVNRQSFHWSMEIHIPWLGLGIFAIGMLALATLSAAVSARQAMRTDSVRAVREDW
ncbi:MAG: FtsX-like permease family protein, partial [Betaproteobacteria bacterium]